MITRSLKELIEHAANWPLEDQNELAEYAREIEARRTRFYTMSDEERAALARGLAAANRETSSPTNRLQRRTDATGDEGSLHSSRPSPQKK